MKGRNYGESTSGGRKMSRLRSVYRKIKALSPIPYLVKALDFYVRSISECARTPIYCGVSGLPGGRPVSTISLPESFSRSDDEFAELVRANSHKSISSPEPSHGKETPTSSNTHSVGRIDEDIPCYFGGSFRKIAARSDLRCARTKSSQLPEFPVSRKKLFSERENLV